MTYATQAEIAINYGYRLGDSAIYDPCNGAPKSVTVLHTHAAMDALNEGGIGVRINEDAIYVRKSEVESPKQGDKVKVYSHTYTVDSAEAYNQWEWLLNVRA